MKYEEKEFLITAVRCYDVLKNSQKTALKFLLILERQGIIDVHAADLSAMCETTAESVYHTIKSLESEGFLKSKLQAKRWLISLNWNKFEEVKQHRKTQLQALKEILEDNDYQNYQNYQVSNTNSEAYRTTAA